MGLGRIDSIRARIEAVLTRLRPQLKDDGGDVEVDKVAPDGVVTLKLRGCSRCPLSRIALIAGLDEQIRQDVPEVTKVEAEVAGDEKK